MEKLIKTITREMNGYMETIEVWEYEDYYSLNLINGDISVSGSLEEIKGEYFEIFGEELCL